MRLLHLRLHIISLATIWLAVTFCVLLIYPIYSNRPDTLEQVVWPGLLAMAGLVMCWMLFSGLLLQRILSGIALLAWSYFFLCWGYQLSPFGSINRGSSEEKTAVGVNRVEQCITVHLMDYNTGEWTSKRALGEVLLKCRMELGEGQDIRFQDDGGVVDVGGRPLHIDVSAALDHQKKPVVRVWSEGLNGIDEDGQGDDIIAGGSSK